jgi:hypothetical protein
MTNRINNLFAKALGVAEPWFVKDVNFDDLAVDETNLSETSSIPIS